MSFPRYPKYKPSGVEWLGEVPEHWRSAPLKTVATCNDDVLDEGTLPDTQIEYVDISSVEAGKGISSTEPMRFAAAPSRARRLVKDGDVIVSTVRTYLRAVARIQRPEPSVVVSTGFAVVRPSALVDSAFLGYALTGSHFIESVIARSTGISYPAINASDLMRIDTCIPPLPEQRAIAAFLDRETAKIDALVAEQERLIELLAEKRQAVISHAVTKGLDLTAPMKPSGVEWLGDVPAHWEIVQLKRFVRMKSGESITSDSIHEVGDHPVYGGNGLRGYTNSFTHDGDYVLVGRQGALCGNVNYASGRFWASEHAVVVEPVRPASTKWLGELLRTMNLNQYSVSAAQPGLSVESIVALWAVFPPVEEQVAISTYLNRQTTAADVLSNDAKAAIDLLKERRSALISAAVTGQIDVRNAVPESAA